MVDTGATSGGETVITAACTQGNFATTALDDWARPTGSPTCRVASAAP